jgi:eukaryotic-like serine/threonine-protein kinase
MPRKRPRFPEAEHRDRALPPSQPKHSVFTVGDVGGGRYEVIRFVAKGGMGEVYEVEDRELRSRVALKTIELSPVLSPSLMTRFKREIQLARKVTHRNVCRVYDLGHHNLPAYGDILFLTMEFLQGTAARRWKLDSRLSWTKSPGPAIEARLWHRVHRAQPGNRSQTQDGRKL